MSSHVRNITFDCADPERVGRWWAELTGYGDHPDNPNEAGDPEWLLYSSEQQFGLLFVAVPEAKTVKNRVHLDMQPTDRTRDEEVERLLGLGATLVADHRKPDGSGFVVLADIEGNELCIEQSAAERATTPGE
jgi:hypothetical protein